MTAIRRDINCFPRRDNSLLILASRRLSVSPLKMLPTPLCCFTIQLLTAMASSLSTRLRTKEPGLLLRKSWPAWAVMRIVAVCQAFPGIGSNFFFEFVRLYTEWWEKANSNPAILPFGETTIDAAAVFSTLKKRTKLTIFLYVATWQLLTLKPRSRSIR
jgi:hypothetical protein